MAKHEAKINFRLSPELVEDMDLKRGAWSRSTYIRAAIRYATINGVKGPDEDTARPEGSDQG